MIWSVIMCANTVNSETKGKTERGGEVGECDIVAEY